MIVSKAPTRIADIGGWTDTRFYKSGAVVNIPIDLCTWCFIKEREDKEVVVRDINENLVSVQHLDHFDYNKGFYNLIKACVASVKLDGGIEITIKSEAPMGAGMGTSASLCVAVLAGLYELKGYKFSKEEIARDAHKIETEYLNLESGIQDQYASAFGSVRFYGINYPFVIENEKIKQLQQEKFNFELESRLTLVYLYERSSSKMHEKVIKEYNEHIEIEYYLDEIRDCAYLAKTRLNREVAGFGKYMTECWDAQKKLHPDMTSKTIDKLEKICKDFGVLGFKVNGAGGGGTATVMSKAGDKFFLEKKLLEEGFKILPVKINTKGVEVYRI